MYPNLAMRRNVNADRSSRSTAIFSLSRQMSPQSRISKLPRSM
jgi:hypothetical protein